MPDDLLLRGVHHLETHMVAGLAFDPGLSKTSTSLAAFCNLKADNKARTMLVIAPLRVCRRVWRQEGAKWTQFRHLRFSLLHGSKKAERLKDDADVWLINPEGVMWLSKLFFGRTLPFDIVCIDELTRFKNHQSERSKALRPRIAGVPRKWGLTGSLAPNGYMDLFGQQLVLDGGAALGRYITHYRDNNFSLGHDGFTYTLIPGAEHRILAKLAPYWLQASADDYLKLPPIVPDPILLDLEKPEQAVYDKMKRDMIATLPGGVVTAANAAACYSKLAQMANGAVYIDTDGARKVEHLHDVKLDALEELIADLAGKPILVAYEFNHDFERLRERFGVTDPVTKKKVLPYLGKGTTAKQEEQWIDAWNRGQLPYLFAHPASAGHGLNLQEAHAAHICWWSPIWDLELWDQFIRRLRRRGNDALRIFNHILIVRGTIDELKLAAIEGKDTTQQRLLKILNAAIQREGAEAQAGGETQALDDRRIPMVVRLSRQDTGGAAAGPAPQQQTQQAPVRPAGWGNQGQAVQQPVAQTQQPAQERVTPKGWAGAGGGQAAAPQPAAQEEQRERIAEVINPGASAFSPQVAEQREAIEQGNYTDSAPQPAEAPKRTRTRTPKDTAETTSAVNPVSGWRDPADAIEFAGLMKARAIVMQGVIVSDPNATVADIIETTRELMEFVARG